MIKIRNLWKRYGNLDVLKGLNLEVNRGEILVILGRSGVGKSVLLRHIIGIEKPDLGSIEVNNTIISSLKKNDLYHAIKNMGMLFQGSALFDSMNIEENTAFYLKQHGTPPEEIEPKVYDALAMVGLSGSEKKMPSDLSGGMRKRAGLARLIVYRPSILLYDEPTTGLDPITAQQINELIVKT
ncbi:MAG TPA: ATP-binding cassette domain-containing protein, partial [Chlamydiales bacterium]|nr:ATP-binding cassette domain-containing protein [Chlamydiales bacterium]